jgi:hypothetical protein
LNKIGFKRFTAKLVIPLSSILAILIFRHYNSRQWYLTKEDSQYDYRDVSFKFHLAPITGKHAACHANGKAQNFYE